MDPDWSLVLEDVSDRGVRLAVESGQQRYALSRFCADEKELDSEIRRLQSELQRLAEQGREHLARQREQEAQADPVQIWQEMDALADEEEMVSYFNALPRAIRSKVAEYVLTRVSAFKGMAPQFQGRYNSETNVLE